LHTSDLFKSFSLWSEHLVLHTKESLNFIIQSAGWEVSELVGFQRYPIWNHLHWLIEGNPSGLKSAVLDSTAMNLQGAYEQYLISRDLTDTLLVIARKKEQIP
jgi:hypothetical protein